MERVTQKNERGYYLLGDGIYSDWGVPEKFRGDAVDRLAAYEDTGLEPDTISGIRDIVLDIYGDFDRLRELVQADREGRCVLLPCKVGDTVYVINRHQNRVFECTVISFSIGKSTDLKNYVKTKWVGPNGNESIRKWTIRQFGKYVSLAREEAEAALKGESHETDPV